MSIHQKIATGLLGGDDGEQVEEFELSSLLPFANHPFQVKQDESFQALQDSIAEQGLAVPILVRTHPTQRGCYEIIAGHRRVEACRLLGKETIAGFIRDLDEEEAVLFMVDTNIQREELLFSEKAFAYRMKLEALKRKAGRPKKVDEKNGGQVGHNFSESDDEKNGGQVGHNFSEGGDEKNGGQVGHNFPEGGDEKNGGQVGHNFSEGGDEKNGGQVGHNFPEGGDEKNGGQVGHHKKGRDLVADGSPDSARNIQRYIRLTYLDPYFLDMVDEKKLPFLVGVDLSYLNTAEQRCLWQFLQDHNLKPNLAQASALKEASQEGGLTGEKLRGIFLEQKPKVKRLSLQGDLRGFFPQDTSDKEMEEIIIDLLRRWKESQ